MDSTAYVKKQTLYLAIITALILGFLGGVVFSVYRAPEGGGQQQTADRQQEIAAAIASLEEATRTNPNSGKAWADLGHAYFDTEQMPKAIAAYNKALELMPGDTNIMTDMGVMYHRSGDHAKAIELFEAVLKLNPQHEQARFNKGVVLFTGLNDRQTAIAEWKILIQHHPMAAAPSGKMVADLITDLEKEDQAKK